MNKILRLLELGEKYNIKQNTDNLTYEINDYENELVAIIDGDDVSYYVTGAYNSGIDYLDINMKALDELKEFVKGLTDDKIEKDK